MGEFALGVELRDGRGKGVARKLRAAGQIPGICYRRNSESIAVSLDPNELDRLIRNASSGINTLIDLKVAGGGDFDGRQVLIKELQRDPISGAYLHADLYAVITHPVLSGPAIKRIAESPLKELVVTDTIPLRPDARDCSKLQVVTIAPLLGEAIRRIHNEESVSSLFV